MPYDPGVVRDAILKCMKDASGPVRITDIYEAVNAAVGSPVPKSSVRSYLNFNTPGKFERVGRGTYRLRKA